VKGKYNLVADALSRMYDSISTKLYDWENGMVLSNTAAKHANVGFLPVHVLSFGDVQVEKSVMEELQRDYGKDETTRRRTLSLGSSSTRPTVCKRLVCGLVKLAT
jgi:hypothetical protein